jgi:hypothetical protein
MFRACSILATVVSLSACGQQPTKTGRVADGGTPDAGLWAKLVNTRFVVADAMRAGVEMQLSGEPFAQLLGYNLTGFSRTIPLTDQYFNPATGQQTTDPLGYALAVESYEYSKQPMNNLSFESGAGLSLMFGPVLNPDGLTTDGGFNLLADRFQQFAIESNAGGSLGTNLIVSPAPTTNPFNYYGWPGLWPVFAEFSDFDPSITPAPGAVSDCTFGGQAGAFGYGGPVTVPKSIFVENYECDYNTLNLVNRDTQANKTLSPAALGYASWKQSLSAISYWATLHDTAGNGITQVAAADLPQVGQPGNTVIGEFSDPADPTGQTLDAGAPGVFFGEIPMSGWQGLTMMEEIDDKSALLLESLLSGDGKTLQSVSSFLAADQYSYDSPLLFFPAAVGVVETPQTTDLIEVNKYFPQPTGFSVQDGGSALQGLSGLLAGFGEAFAFTDRNNATVGGSQPFLATFDGDPFPEDDGLPDGENTLHDRALGVIKIAAVDLDRLHFDAANQVLVDWATVSGGSVTQGTTVTTVELAEAILALRVVFRSLNGSLQLDANDTSDTLGAPGALDSAPLTGAPYVGTLQGRLTSLITAEADFLSTHLIAADGGAVANGYDLSSQLADPSPTDLAAEVGAVRALLEAYLATTNEAYRDLAVTVFGDLQQRFWMADVRCFRTTVGQDNPVQFTPIRFGLLSGALRQYYKLVASSPGNELEGNMLLQELKRSYKLVLNGWDDVNQDDKIQFPQECLPTGMQMGERALTAELPGNGDWDSDCIKEISIIGLPAALGAELDISFH